MLISRTEVKYCQDCHCKMEYRKFDVLNDPGITLDYRLMLSGWRCAKCGMIEFKKDNCSQ